jgi:hypothetical protein
MSDIDSLKKWKISLFSLCLFLIVTHDKTYSITNGIIGNIIDVSGKVTMKGYVIHAIVFLLLVRYSMDLQLFKE